MTGRRSSRFPSSAIAGRKGQARCRGTSASWTTSRGKRCALARRFSTGPTWAISTTRSKASPRWRSLKSGDSRPTTNRSRIRFSKAISRIPSIGCRPRARCLKTAKGGSPHSTRASLTRRTRRFMHAFLRRTWSCRGASRRSAKRVRECGERSSWLRLSPCRKGHRISKRRMTCSSTEAERSSAMSTTFFSTTSIDCRRRFLLKNFVAQTMRLRRSTKRCMPKTTRRGAPHTMSFARPSRTT